MHAGIAIGSNLGDRLENLRRARTLVRKLPGVSSSSRDILSAPVFATDPVDCPPGSGPFLNTAIEVVADESVTPQALMAALRRIEVELGRPSRHPRHAPRSVDLDLLYLDAITLQTSDLILPHPRLHERRFVLAPLAAIRPDLILPGHQKSVQCLLRELDDPGKVMEVQSIW